MVRRCGEEREGEEGRGLWGGVGRGEVWKGEVWAGEVREGRCAPEMVQKLPWEILRTCCNIPRVYWFVSLVRHTTLNYSTIKNSGMKGNSIWCHQQGINPKIRFLQVVFKNFKE